jgi:hypothetical protein
MQYHSKIFINENSTSPYQKSKEKNTMAIIFLFTFLYTITKIMINEEELVHNSNLLNEPKII